MKKRRVEEVLSANLRELLGYSPDTGRCLYHPQTFLVNEADPDAGVSQATIGRILHAEASATIGVLEKIATFFELEPWQLLVGDFKRSNPPMLRALSPSEQQLYRRFQDMWKALGDEGPEPT